MEEDQAEARLRKVMEEDQTEARYSGLNLFSREAVGRRLRIFREGLGKTLREMSEEVGSDGGQLWNNYEQGRRLIPVDSANLLTLLYGLDIGWIYQGRLDQLGPRLAEIIRRGEALISNHPRAQVRRWRRKQPPSNR